MKMNEFQKLIQAARDVNSLKASEHRIVHNFYKSINDQVDIDDCQFMINGDQFTEEEAIISHGAFWNDLVETIVINSIDTDTHKTESYHTINLIEAYSSDEFDNAKKFFESMLVQSPAPWTNAIKVA